MLKTPSASPTTRQHSAFTLLRTLPLCVAVALSISNSAYAQVQADGGTATTVLTQANGHQVITPAAAQHDISYNSFNRFDVDAAGATFANGGVGARTIVAEVFSPLPSRIEGPVGIDGPRANLILANQNGLRVNGGSFVNFGSLALTTGVVSLRDQQLAPGVYQRYVDVRTRGGDIQIEAGGLEANLIRLELVARQVGIHGPITNTYTSASAKVGVTGGASLATYDTLASPTDNLTPWASYSSLGESSDAIVIDVTADSIVRSGRIELVVTEAGAGVRNAGLLSATSGDFRITSTGYIEQIGGRIEALGDVRIQTDRYLQHNNGDRASALVAGGSARITASDSIRNLGGAIQGQAGSATYDDMPYAVRLDADGLVEINTPTGQDSTALVFGAAGDVQLHGGAGVRVSNARVVSNAALALSSDGDVVVESRHNPGKDRHDWNSSGLLVRRKTMRVDRGALSDPDQLGYLVADGDLNIQGGNVYNYGGQIFSNADGVDISALDDVTNQGVATGSFAFQSRCTLFLCRRRAQSTETLNGGQVSAATQIRVSAGGTVLNDGGQFLSMGDTTIDAPFIIARAQPIMRAWERGAGLKAYFGDTWAQLYASDQGGGFTAQQGRLILRGATRQEGGFFAARDGVEGQIEIVREPQRDRITIDDHLGILRW